LAEDLSDFGESLAARWLVTGETANRPSSYELALYSAAPSDAGGGTELAGSGYSRQAVSFVEGGAGYASNDADITFSATGAWAVVAAGLFDDGGNLLLWTAIGPVSVANGQNLIISAGQLTVTFQ
jgi:hypothetical protein